ncbi:glycosyltransferase family 2 protein [Spirosoma luteum]|uniref:glycosyltransferase family 2 protein n=1 Tax=Spirosoma luteum TaxID=431553 RepID=UPI0012F89C34|nr:glycosyltransferase family 2 protein [Spirosoma luteum]
MPESQSLEFQTNRNLELLPHTVGKETAGSEPEPILSIVIPVYNGVQFIEAAIQSVINQCYKVELIIIDGGSTDGSLDVIKRYANWITYAISEPDAGIYDAMNKGIDKATGKWVFFLGADDVLQPGVLKEVAPYLSKDKVLIFGDVLFENGLRFPSFFSARTVFQNTIHHQGAFYRYSLFDGFRYNTNLRILSDYELNLIIYQHKLPVQKVPLIIACCREGGASSQIQLSISETNYIRSLYLPNKTLNWALAKLLKTYYAQKRLRSWLIGLFYKKIKNNYA